MAGGNPLRANRTCSIKQLVKLQVVIAERARNRRAASQVFIHKRPHHIALEPVFLVDHVVGNAEVLGHAAGVVDVVEGAAATGLRSIRDTMLAREPHLVP